METGGNEEVVRAGGPVELVSMAWSRCIVSTRQIVTTVTGIFRGSLDSSALGGPILIAQIAHRSTRSGTGQFLWLLGTLSINLMFLNVLPIPVLDGGQLALLALEAVLRRRPSESVVGIAQMAGLLLILSLVVLVSYNDIVRNLGP
jgi:regulator of sigma E protease